jgi:hypothetical protein
VETQVCSQPFPQGSHNGYNDWPEAMPSNRSESSSNSIEQLKDLRARVGDAEEVLGVDKKSAWIAELESVTLKPGFWEDQTKAQRVMGKISKHQEELQMVTGWKGTLDDICVALELYEESDDVRFSSARHLQDTVRAILRQ